MTDTSIPFDPTTAEIVARNTTRDQLRADVARLEQELGAAHTALEVMKTDRDRLVTRGDAMFEEGYDQAVREIGDHFAEQRRVEVVAEIVRVWITEKKRSCARCGMDITNTETDHRLFRCTGGSGSVTVPNEQQSCHKCKKVFGLADGGFLEELDADGDRLFACESCEPSMAPRE